MLSYKSSTTGGPDSIADSDIFDNNNAIEVTEENVVLVSGDSDIVEQPDDIPKGDELRALIEEYNKHADGLEMTSVNEMKIRILLYQ